MNHHKFAFIICTNNDTYLSECLHYLESLIVPDGYEIECLTIRGAASMAAGYNEGMSATDAKYKIYMHQDVFIVNPHFLKDTLAIFSSDASIGMIGMVGYPVISKTGFMWHEKRVGANPLYGVKHAYPHADYTDYRYSLNDGLSDAALLDGFLLMTAYDLPWNEVELTGWDFYDAFQSMEFLLHGYRVVAPAQTLPWCIHDDGKWVSMWNYNKYRQLFLQKYDKYLGLHYSSIRPH